DINETAVKIVATHVGLDVGEDGPTHQCIDYLGLLRNYFRFSVFAPADPNQTDRIVRYVAAHPGNFFVGMGRSIMPVITKEDGTPFFGEGYEFRPGKGDWLRRGGKGTIVTYGAVTPNALAAWQLLREEGIAVGVLNMASLLPVDREALIEAARSGPVLTVEDHHVDTGLGAIAGMVLAEAGIAAKLRRLGVSRYGASGKPADLYASQGLDGKGIAAAFKKLL
ncbi:MAG: transketolase, partial [Desulfobacteraceae bacterium]|nr:transketolase [Desulfobacteraceae bacterium]